MVFKKYLILKLIYLALLLMLQQILTTNILLVFGAAGFGNLGQMFINTRVGASSMKSTNVTHVTC